MALIKGGWVVEGGGGGRVATRLQLGKRHPEAPNKLTIIIITVRDKILEGENFGE